jgi:hypothetical protein
MGVRRSLFRRRIARTAASISAHVDQFADPATGDGPIAFLNITSSPGRESFTQFIGLVTGWSQRAAGREVQHWLCAGGVICPQGITWRRPKRRPPCKQCKRFRSGRLPEHQIRWLRCAEFPDGLASIDQLGRIDQLAAVTYRSIPIGRLCLPSVRHSLKRHTLKPDERTLWVYRSFLRAAAGMADQVCRQINRQRPAMAVLFNGYTWPEAVARAAFQAENVPTFTWEVGFQPYSALLSAQLAPDAEVAIPAGFTMTPERNARLDEQLSRRWKGDFSMGGVRFWKEMLDWEGALGRSAGDFQQILPIFTNTVYDTSQCAANTAFESMLDWLEQTLSLAEEFPDTLFLVRAHPAEVKISRSGRSYRTAEPIHAWLAQRGLDQADNVQVVPAHVPIDSYQLIRAAPFCLVYNSTIGLEALMIGKSVILGGHSKYSDLSFLPKRNSPERYFETLRRALRQGLATSEAQRQEARRFFYFLFHHASLPLGGFAGDRGPAGEILARTRRPSEFLPQNDPALGAIDRGLHHRGDFFLPYA